MSQDPRDLLEKMSPLHASMLEEMPRPPGGHIKEFFSFMLFAGVGFFGCFFGGFMTFIGPSLGTVPDPLLRAGPFILAVGVASWGWIGFQGRRRRATPEYQESLLQGEIYHANLELQHGSPAGGIQKLEALLDRRTLFDNKVLAMLAEAYLESGDPDRARERAEAIRPEHVSVERLESLAKALEKAGLVESAVHVAEVILAIQDDHPLARRLAARGD